jgi:hypothetical protein
MNCHYLPLRCYSQQGLLRARRERPRGRRAAQKRDERAPFYT